MGRVLKSRILLNLGPSLLSCLPSRLRVFSQDDNSSLSINQPPRRSADIPVCRATDFPVGRAGARPEAARFGDGPAGLKARASSHRRGNIRPVPGLDSRPDFGGPPFS